MALQTEPRSAPTSSPTSDAASETSASPTPSPNSTDAGGFTLTASPPLILAFLAVGMFAISMIVFFGWRRIAAARTPWAPPSEAVSIGERPKIWDVWMSCEQSQETFRAEWRNIQPLSATIWDHAPPVLPPDNPPPPRHQSLAMEAFTHLRQRYRERHRRQEDAMLEAKSSSSESLLRLQLQVAVTIAMPTPDFVGTSSRPENTDDDEQLSEYSIGLYEIPWKKTH